MPENYTGNEGTAAAADGMAVADGTEDRREGWLGINKTRDYIVAKCAAVLNSAKAYADQKVGAISLTWNAITGKPSEFPPSPHLHNALGDTGGAYFRWTGTQWLSNALIGILNHFEVANNATVGGHLILNTATPVTTGYVAMYRNSDGRVGISPSARKFKKEISPRVYTLDDLSRIRVVSYRLRSWVFGDENAPTDVGVIAEELIDAGLSEFVVFDDEGKPLSVHYERLALVAIGALQELAHGVDLLAQRLDALEGA